MSKVKYGVEQDGGFVPKNEEERMLTFGWMGEGMWGRMNILQSKSLSAKVPYPARSVKSKRQEIGISLAVDV